MTITKNDALLVVDVQQSFCPGTNGSLAVEDGDGCVKSINAVMPLFDWVIASRDAHPDNHCSFVENGGQWPKHCVKGTDGWDFHPRLDLTSVCAQTFKGTSEHQDAYSAYRGTLPLTHILWALGVQRVFVVGIATDVCVAATAADAMEDGFEAIVIGDATCGVTKESTAASLKTMSKQGIKVINVADLF